MFSLKSGKGGQSWNFNFHLNGIVLKVIFKEKNGSTNGGTDGGTTGGTNGGTSSGTVNLKWLYLVHLKGSREES